jgi:hypothetical protein
MYQRYYGVVETKKYVLQGSILSCQYGTKLSKLDCLEDHGVYSGGNPVMTISDCAVSNIHSFGSCLCPEKNYEGRLPMTVAQDSKGTPAKKAPGNNYAHICVPVINENSVWHQVDSNVLIKAKQKGYVPMLVEEAVLVCQYGGIIRVKEVSNTTKKKVLTVGGWLRLYSEPTLSLKGRTVVKHPDAKNYDWAVPEELKKDGNKENFSTSSMAAKMIKELGNTLEVHKEKNNVYTDLDGRYWVAIGPKYMNPYHTSNMKIKPEKMNYGTKIDIHVVGQHDGKDYYIPAVVGDVKEHSKPDGLYQTGVPFDSKRITVEGDGSTVEFIGYGITEFVDPKDGISKTTINYTNEFKLIELIIYDSTNN